VSYQEGNLILPGVAVADEEANAYFEDVMLRYEGDGLFRVVEVSSRTLVAIEFLHVHVLQGEPEQALVTIKGFKSNPCVELLAPAISRAENRFSIVLAESQLTETEICVNATGPFTTAYVLELSELASGDYLVLVNGERIAFSFESIE